MATIDEVIARVPAGWGWDIGTNTGAAGGFSAIVFPLKTQNMLDAHKRKSPVCIASTPSEALRLAVDHTKEAGDGR